MRPIPFLLLLFACATISSAQPHVIPRTPGIVMTIPLLPYVFFDSASASIPVRYHRYTDPAQTLAFDEASLGADPLEQHRHILDIIGARMRASPGDTVRITGCNSEQESAGETKALSMKRAIAVRDYLVRIWGIDTGRLPLASRGMPSVRSNPKDPRGLVENRRAELQPTAQSWQLERPVTVVTAASPIDERRLELLSHVDSVDWRALLPRSRLGVFWMIKLLHDSPDIGPLSQRVVREMVLPSLDSSRVVVIGSTDEVGADDRNLKLSKDRAAAALSHIRRNAGPGDAVVLRSHGTGESAPILPNDLPEGRLCNRNVVFYVLTPLR